MATFQKMVEAIASALDGDFVVSTPEIEKQDFDSLNPKRAKMFAIAAEGNALRITVEEPL